MNTSTPNTAAWDAPPGSNEPESRLSGLTTGSIRGLAFRVICSSQFIAMLVIGGIVLRVLQYAADRSLWADEAEIALNLIHRPLGGLFSRLDYGAAVPPGFALLEGVVAKTGGYSEYALRVVPLIAGVASVPAFVVLARRFLSRATASFSVLLFVFSGELVYYSSELKPYEFDVTASVLLLLFGTWLLDSTLVWTRLRATAVATAGIGLLVCSFAAIFVVAGVAAAYVGHIARGPAGRWKARPLPSAIAGCWGLVSLAIVIIGYRNASVIRENFGGGSSPYLGITGSPSPLGVVDFMGSQIAAGEGFVQQRPYSEVLKLALVVAVIGFAALLRRHPSRLLMLVVPFPLLLVAARIHAYPLAERTEMFLIPATILLIAEGVAQVVRWLPHRAQIVTAVALGAILAAGPVSLAATRLVSPQRHEETRPVLRFVRDHWRAGETLYVQYEAQLALRYYEECKCADLTAPGTDRELWPLQPISGAQEFDPSARALSTDVVLGHGFEDDWPLYFEDLHRLGRRRYVWIFFSHAGSLDEVAFFKYRFVNHLNSVADLVAGIDEPGAHAYLYRLTAAHW